MERKIWLVCGGVILCVLLGLPLSLSLADSDVEVSINVPAGVDPDSDFTARVNVTELSDFDACQFDVTYDPGVIEVTDVTAGNIGGTTIPIDMWGFIPAGTQGTVRVIGNVPSVPGVDGSGYLAEIHFHAIGSPGSTSAIDLSNGLLGDNGANPITPVTWVGAAITVNNPLPAITSLSPVSATVGSPGFTLTVNGSNFVSGWTVVQWNGAVRTTTFVNSRQLTAAITDADIATAGTANVTVVNPAPGGGTSNALPFEIIEFGPEPPPNLVYLPLILYND